MTNRDLDLLCMGRAAVDLYAEQLFSSLEEASTFAKYVGGCPANIAIGGSRLGLKTGILSRVGDEAMGRFVKRTLEDEGVDVTSLKSDPDRLTGLVLLGINPPDHFPLIFYRENCADMAIEESDFDLSTFQRVKALLITGTHCSTETSFQTTLSAVALAKEAGTLIVLDIDYRPVLWGATGHGGGEERYIAHHLFAERMSLLFSNCDLIVGTEEELLAALDKTEINDAISTLRKQTRAMLVQKRGELGCKVYPSNRGSEVEGPAYPVKVLNVLGAGDAFMSGFLRGFLRDCSLEECCRLGNANGALVVTRHGCSPAMPYWNELQHFLRQPDDLIRTEHLHRIHGRKKKNQYNCFLAFDHRIHFRKLADKHNVPTEEISILKKIIFDAAEETRQDNQGEIDIGVIVDDEFGEGALRSAGDSKITIAKPIESPNSFPLRFLEGREASDILKTWPKHHIIKVLFYVQPDTVEVDQAQVKTLKKLYHAARRTGHQLIVELAYLGKSYNLSAIALTIQGCYKAGIFPEWWKLPPTPDEESWRTISHLIKEYDPHINGVLILGAHLPMEELTKALNNTSHCCKNICGFAIGRSIWHPVAEQWFEGTVDNTEAKKLIKKQFQNLIDTWKDNLHSKESLDDRHTEKRTTQKATI